MGALLIGQRHRSDGAGDVAGPFGSLAVEARVGAHVRQGKCLAGREHEPGDALAGLHALADGTRTLWPRRYTEFEAIRIGLEQGDRGCLGVEQAHGRVDDGLKQSLLAVRVEPGRDRGPMGARSNDGQGLVQGLAISSSGTIGHRGIA